MSRLSTVGFAATIFLTGTLAYSASAQSGNKPAPSGQVKVGPVAPPATDAEKIKSAMSAGPASIAANATIVDMATMKPLRKGTNGWTCFSDLPTSPGTDPMCLDQNGMLWADALMNRKDPPKGRMGFGYMLMGGSDASNTDPFATKPNGADKWVDTGPHVMVLNIGDQFAGYPTTAANTKVPYVMFPGTPYAHLMLPVK
ncbi:MAG TPA: hypothetical protein VN700_04000 [Vicinamibacterales bacterium]|nr:hypothetical protein [Vicinamibacterales bacterium]